LPYGGYVASLSLAIAAVMTFPFAPAGIINRLRAVVDGIILAAALAFVAAAVGVATSPKFPLGYPVVGILLITLLASSRRKSVGSARTTLALLLGAYALQLIGDVSGLVTSGTHVGSLVLVGLAGWWPADVAPKEREREPADLWQLVIPWTGALAVIGTASWAAAGGARFDSNLLSTALVIGVLFVLSQVLALNDSLGWLRRTRTAESQLRSRRELMAEIIEEAPLGIARVDPNLRILESNPRLAEMLGVSQRVLGGAPLGQFISDDDVVAARKRMELMSAGKLDRAEVDTEMRTADGRVLWVHRVVTPVFGPGGRVDYYVVMFEDETAKHEAEQAALRNLESLEKLSRLKSEFISTVSHEFRTALTGIQGYSEVMKGEAVSPEEVKEFSGDIYADATRLNRMINDMLDADRIESGKVEVHWSEVDLNKLVCDAADRARMSTSRHDIRVRTDPGGVSVRADADRLMQVVANLLSNAIKYSPDGGDIFLSTALKEGHVEVSVADQGMGIPPEFQARIFGRFERFEGAGMQKTVGTGLGLALARQIIELHHGRIWVQSEVGRGATFTFAIPTNATSNSARDLPPAMRDPSRDSGL
jgi:PAS domain S-box-containing protein